MPAVSKAQRRLMAIAEHHPSEVYAKNKGVLSMNKQQLHDFASTKEKKMPEHKKEETSKKSNELKNKIIGHVSTSILRARHLARKKQRT